MTNFASFSGRITRITDYRTEPRESGCNKLMTVEKNDGRIVNFVITPTTYFVDHVMVSVGDVVVGFYDADSPTIMIYPPQYPALVVSKLRRGENIKVSHFNRQLVSRDGKLKLNIGPSTEIILENDQLFTANPANRDLIVQYGPVTRSIPAQTTPRQIVVLCLENR